MIATHAGSGSGASTTDKCQVTKSMSRCRTPHGLDIVLSGVSGCIMEGRVQPRTYVYLHIGVMMCKVNNHGLEDCPFATRGTASNMIREGNGLGAKVSCQLADFLQTGLESIYSCFVSIQWGATTAESKFARIPLRKEVGELRSIPSDFCLR